MPVPESVRLKLLWLFLAVSGFAAIEPSPYEVMFFVCLFAFASGGLVFDAAIAPLILILCVFDAAGMVALIPFADQSPSVSFTFISVYITFTMMLFASLVPINALARMQAIRSGYVFAGTLSAFLGIVGYLDVAGSGSIFAAYGHSRASGVFKDPNVFGPFLVAPIGWIAQDLLLARRSTLRSLPPLLILITAIFLSFSRGAIIDALFTLVLLFGFTYITTKQKPMRVRVIKVFIGGILLLMVLGAIVASIPSIAEVAADRATLTEDYDKGEQGRFGNQLRSIPMLLDRPLGFGPYRFFKYFPADPHEVFLSAFASFGWTGGIAFTVFVALTIYVGFTFVFKKTQVQTEIIGVFAGAFPQLLQGVQIDTIHWRHLFMLFGCLFGLAAAAAREERGRNFAPERVKEGRQLRATP